MRTKAIRVVIGFCLALVVAVAASMPWRLSGHAIRHQLAKQILSLTGLSLQNAGRTTISALPRPRIKIVGVALHDPDGALDVDTQSIRGDLRILPLLIGRIEVASIELRHPVISVDLDGKPLVKQGALARAADTPDASPQVKTIDATRLGVVRIESGTVLLKSRTRKISTLFDDVNMTLDWRSLDRPASLVGNATWHDRPLSVSAWLGHPIGLLRATPSAINIKISSNRSSFAAMGSITTGAHFAYRGNLKAATSALPFVARILSVPIHVPERLAEASISANASVEGSSVDLSDLHLSLGSSDFEGSLSYRDNATRPLLSATLATDSLTLDPYLSFLPPAVDRDGEWDRASLPAGFRLADVDLRVSATRARAFGLRCSDAALAAMLTNGHWEFSVGEAKAYGGAFKLNLASTPTPAGQALKGTLAVSKMDAAALLAAGWHTERLTGIASGQFIGETTGASISEFMQNLKGQAKLDIRDGEIAGLDLEQALRRLDKRPLSIGGDLRSGRTSFQRADGILDVAGGTAALRDFTVTGGGVSLVLTGDAHIADRMLAIDAVARLTGPTGDNGPKLHMDLSGSFDDPHLMLDAASLVRRSEAAAPLFDDPPAATTQAQ